MEQPTSPDFPDQLWKRGRGLHLRVSDFLYFVLIFAFIIVSIEIFVTYVIDISYITRFNSGIYFRIFRPYCSREIMF